MRTKVVIKKIAALGTGIAMMGATMAGALAADLNQYPSMFFQDGRFNAAVVVGDQAAAIDVVGAIDLAFSLQYEAKVSKTVSLGGEETVTASSGVEVSATGNHLTLNEALNSVESQFKKDDLPVLLADGTVTDDSDNEDYDYSQKLIPSSDQVKFGLPDDDIFGDVPQLYLDQSSGAAYTVVVEFDTALNATALDDSEKITIMGKTFTFDPDMQSGDNTLVLYASEKTETISVGESKTITLDDGTTLDVELIGANSDRETATIKVNGETHSVSSGDTITAGGTQIYINDVFTYNIPSPGAAVEFFVGSDKIEIDASGGYNDVEIDDKTVTGVEASVGGGLEAIDEINFTVTPSEFDEKQYRYLMLGESFVDPLFDTFKMEFASVTPELKASDKTKISLTRSGDDYELSFVNKDGETYEFTVFHSDSGSDTVEYGEDFVGKTDNVTDDGIFILNEGDVTKVYQLTSVTTESSTKYANLKDLTDNSAFKVKESEEIGDTGVSIVTLHDGTTDSMKLDANTSLTITTKYDGTITITSDPGNESIYDLEFEEGTTNFDDLAAGDAVTFKVNVTGDSSNGDEDITIAALNITNSGDVNYASDDDNKVEYGVSKFGTYWERERDNYGAYIDFYYPKVETSYHVFFMPSGATTSTTAAGQTLTYYEYNKIGLGAAKLASEITNPAAQNLIVVGGPCANSVAAQLKGNPEDCAAGYEPGKAIIELIENGDKVALLVAGYSGEDTRRATAVLANYQDYSLSGNEVIVTGTSLSDITVSAPTSE